MLYSTTLLLATRKQKKKYVNFNEYHERVVKYMPPKAERCKNDYSIDCQGENVAAGFQLRLHT